jgi:hypothetical protein
MEVNMEERFSVENVCRRFEAAIDRIDRKGRPPSPHEAGTLLRVLRTIKVGDFERATDLLSHLHLVLPAFASAVGSRVAAGPVTTRHLRDRLRELRIKPI